MKNNSGFTLIELLIVVALVGVVMAIGVPSMREFSQNDRLTTQINTLIGHLAYARSEAVKRSQQVGVCVSSNTTSCTGGTDWHKGWIIYVDLDGDSLFDSGEPVLKANQALEGDNTLNPETIGTQVTYDFRGYATAGSIGSFSLCDLRGATYGKTVSISVTGRVRVKATGVDVSC